MGTDYNLQSNIIKTERLESDLEHLTDKVERLCVQIENSLPLLKDLSTTFLSHSETIKKHSHDLEALKDLYNIITSLKFYIKSFSCFIGFVVIASGGYYAYDQNQDRNREHELTMEHLKMENLKLNAEIEEKKKKSEYNREKYLIRNGIENGE